ncbi:MAG: TIGR03986 family CRISPR-associated RAMP protein [Candidatus Cloacimonetes bacterium]|jgi:CRISPR-associated protein (TIGR03986 family)|nr:TIGR03986 family CRISPR-associated RAMP protein [Candidatus Cloacimonadota bacterium]
MQKGSLNIRKNEKKKRVILVLTREDDKIMPISEGVYTQSSILMGLPEGDHEVSYQLENGKLAELKIGEETIKPSASPAPSYDKPSNRGFERGGNIGGRQPVLDGASAPYNFIPLNDHLITVKAEDLPDFDQQKGYDGYLDLEIDAKTPLYIRQTYSAEQMQKLEELAREGNKDEELDYKLSLSGFYRPAHAAYRIPGSSLRGMLRTLFEVATYSKMTYIDDHKLYYRSFADPSTEYRDQYAKWMMESSGNIYYPKVSAGYLSKRGNHYSIKEAVSYHRVEEDLVLKNGIIRESMSMPNKRSPNKYYLEFIKKTPFIEVIFKAESERVHRHSVEMKYSSVSDIQPMQSPVSAGYQRGYLVLSGWIPSRNIGKHMHWVVSEPSTKSYEVPKDLIRDYDKDVNRKGTNLLKFVKQTKEGCPCFYIMDKGQIKAFGHTGLFRMVFNNSIGDLRPEAHKVDDLDLAESVFGLIKGKQIRPGRVFVEDAVCDKAVEMPEAQYPKILSGPKPSSFQHYIAQDVKLIKAVGSNNKNRTGIKNYDSRDARLAGNKFYWHRDHDAWIANPADVNKAKKQYTKIHPLDTGSTFKGRIRFMNLSAAELGALLTIINLPQGCCHKIGMAKPLGLGTVHLRAKLNMIDRSKRYSDLAALGITDADESSFISAFTDLLKNELKIQIDNPWQLDRLKELKAMLDYEHKPPSEKTRYMEIEYGKTERQRGDNEYKLRPILKRPSQINKMG